MLTAEEFDAIRLSLAVAGMSVLWTLPVATGLGYWLARSRSGRNWLIELLINLPLVLPPVVTGFLLLVLFGQKGWFGPLLTAIGLKIVFTWWGAVLAAGCMALPLMVRTIRLAFGSIDPRLEMVARTLGASRWRTFWTISVPLAMPGILSGIVLGFARSLSEFGATIMIAGNIAGKTRTIPLAIYSLTHRPDGWEMTWRLITVSIVLDAVCLLIYDRLERQQERYAAA